MKTETFCDLDCTTLTIKYIKMPVFEISDAHLLENIKKAKIGGKSNVRKDKKSRMDTLDEDQLAGQLAQYIGTVFLSGSDSLYHEQRARCNANPHEGDGGIDVPRTNWDIKGSFMRGCNDPLKYNLIVPPNEFHKGLRYLQCFISRIEENKYKVYIAGWANSADMPKPFLKRNIDATQEKHYLPVTKLKPAMDVYHSVKV